MSDSQDGTADDQYKMEVRATPLELTAEDFVKGLTVFGAPFPKLTTSTTVTAVTEILALTWEAWTPTIAVTQIMLATQPAPGAKPPQTVSVDVTVIGFGFRPNVPVALKWNNAWGFPSTSIPLFNPTPNASGRFSLVLHHTPVAKPGPTWVWEQNNQLVLVAQQKRPNGSIEFEANYRPVPPHVLWQWIP